MRNRHMYTVRAWYIALRGEPGKMALDKVNISTDMYAATGQEACEEVFKSLTKLPPVMKILDIEATSQQLG